MSMCGVGSFCPCHVFLLAGKVSPSIIRDLTRDHSTCTLHLKKITRTPHFKVSYFASGVTPSWNSVEACTHGSLVCFSCTLKVNQTPLWPWSNHRISSPAHHSHTAHTSILIWSKRRCGHLRRPGWRRSYTRLCLFHGRCRFIEISWLPQHLFAPLRIISASRVGYHNGGGWS